MPGVNLDKIDPAAPLTELKDFNRLVGATGNINQTSCFPPYDKSGPLPERLDANDGASACIEHQVSGSRDDIKACTVVYVVPDRSGESDVNSKTVVRASRTPAGKGEVLVTHAELLRYQWSMQKEPGGRITATAESINDPKPRTTSYVVSQDGELLVPQDNPDKAAEDKYRENFKTIVLNVMLRNICYAEAAAQVVNMNTAMLRTIIKAAGVTEEDIKHLFCDDTSLQAQEALLDLVDDDAYEGNPGPGNRANPKSRTSGPGARLQ